MRRINVSHEYEYTMAPDTLSTFVTAAGTGQSEDFPSGAEYMHVSTDVRLFINLETTSVAIPTTSSTATTASTGINILHRAGHEHTYRIPSESTGYSIISASTGVVTVEYWKD